MTNEKFSVPIFFATLYGIQFLIITIIVVMDSDMRVERRSFTTRTRIFLNLLPFFFIIEWLWIFIKAIRDFNK